MYYRFSSGWHSPPSLYSSFPRSLRPPPQPRCANITPASTSRRSRITRSCSRRAKIPIPGNALRSFDISWVDAEASRHYLADRGNTTVTPVVPPHIDVINTRSLKLLDPLPLHAAGNGVVRRLAARENRAAARRRVPGLGHVSPVPGLRRRNAGARSTAQPCRARSRSPPSSVADLGSTVERPGTGPPHRRPGTFAVAP